MRYMDTVLIFASRTQLDSDLTNIVSIQQVVSTQFVFSMVSKLAVCSAPAE